MPKRLDILYVDDEKLNLMVFEMIFKHDHNVFTFTSPFEAHEFLESKSPKLDLIVSDFLMMNQNGLEFKENLVPDYQDIPFVILTGFIEDERIETASQMGHINGYFEKPLDQEKMAEFFAKL